MPEALKEKPIVVHLGNVGGGKTGEKPAAKTRKYAERFTDIRFVGIDVKELSPTPRTEKWQQWKNDFLTGLERLNDGSVTLISSDLSLGQCDDPADASRTRKRLYVGRLQEYTRRVVHIAHKKLRNGGKLMVTTPEHWLSIMTEALNGSPFKPDGVEIRPLAEVEYGRTYWTRSYGKSNTRLFQVTAVK